MCVLGKSSAPSQAVYGSALAFPFCYIPPPGQPEVKSTGHLTSLMHTCVVLRILVAF